MTTDRGCIIVGAGGHARVVADALRAMGFEHAIAFADDDASLEGRTVMGLVVRTPIERSCAMDATFHLALGANALRRRLFERWLAAGARPLDVVHPRAVVSPFAHSEPGVFVAAQAVVGPMARLGAATIINHGAVVDHDCRLGAACHVAPHATLGGGVVMGDEVFVGAGATILPGLHLGKGAMIGAGAVVTRDVPARTTVVGIPARPTVS